MRISKYFFFISLLACLSFPSASYSNNSFEDKWQEDIPENAYKLANTGEKNRRLRRYRSAVNDFKKALKIKKDYYFAAFNLGMAYFMSSGEQKQEAGKMFKLAIEIAESNNISDPLIYDTYGQFLFTQKKYTKAIDNYKKALKIDKRYIQSLNNIGVAYEALNNDKDALKSYTIAMEKGLSIAKINYKRLTDKIEYRRMNDPGAVPFTYFVNEKNKSLKIDSTYFDNDGTAGMAPK